MACTSGWAASSAHHVGDRVAGLAAGAVDGVVAAPARRQQPVDGVAEVVGQHEQLEVGVAGDGVGRDDTPAAGGGQHDDVRARRWRLGGERGRRLERLLDRRRPRDAGGPAGAVEHLVVGRQRAGVARRGAGAALGGPALQQHERLAGGGARRGARAAPGRRRCPRRTPGRRPSPGRRRSGRGSRRR